MSLNENNAVNAIATSILDHPVIGGAGSRGIYKAMEVQNERMVAEGKKESILQKADKLIYGDREKDYGHPKENLKTIAAFWSSYLSNKFKDSGIYVDATDVCQMMVLLKMSRALNGAYKEDTFLDEAGYVGLIGRLQE